MKNRFAFTVLAATACIALAGQSAHAVLITNGATVFDDNFESNTALVTPFDYANASNTVPPYDSDPDNASTGTWTSLTEQISDQDVQVTNAIASGFDPGAAEGSNYLRLVRPGGGTTEVAAGFGTQSSGILRAEFMVYVDTDTDFNFLTSFSEGAAARVQLITWNSGNVVRYRLPSGWTNTGLSYVAGVWQKWEIDYAPGASTFTVTIDGIASAALGVLLAGDVDNLLFAAPDAGTQAYVDAVPVPEPATLALLGLGGLAMLGRRRCK